MWRSLPLFPVLLTQGLWVAIRAARLPEAAGPRQGMTGDGPPLRLLILGDSSAAGVGVATQDEALAGGVVRGLVQDHRVTWQLIARSGATVASARRMLRTMQSKPFDVAVIALGVNDTKNGVSLGRWRVGYAALVQEMRDTTGVRLICLSGVPPLGAFPILPAPLRGILGRRAAQFDTVLREMAARDPALIHLPFYGPLDPAHLASDGFHPGPELYAEWGARVVGALRENGID